MQERKKMGKYHVRLTDEQRANLKAESDRTGIPTNEILRRVVDEYYKKFPVKVGEVIDHD